MYYVISMTETDGEPKYDKFESIEAIVEHLKNRDYKSTIDDDSFIIEGKYIGIIKNVKQFLSKDKNRKIKIERNKMKVTFEGLTEE